MIFTIIGIIFFAGLFILAFTGLLGGPFLFFKILFWVTFVPAFLLVSIAWMVIGRISKSLDRARSKMKEKNSVVDAEVVDRG